VTWHDRRGSPEGGTVLEQIGLAAQNWGSSNGHLPPGYLGTYPDLVAPSGNQYGCPAQFVGVLASLLPYLEQGGLYQNALAGLPADYLSTTAVHSPWWAYPSAWSAAQSRVKTFLCPADDAYANTTATFVATHSFVGQGFLDEDIGFFPVGGGGDNLGRTN
jgi:hypothetical protein